MCWNAAGDDEATELLNPPLSLLNDCQKIFKDLNEWKFPHYWRIQGRLLNFKSHPSKTDFKCFLLSFFQLLLLQDSLLPSVLLLSWQKVFRKTTSTASFYGFSRRTKVPASRCVTSYSEINLFRSLSLFFSSACTGINRRDAWFAAAPALPGLFGNEWEISHSLHPADLWPCCTSAAPASAAARRLPARPSAAAEHPNKRERLVHQRTSTEALIWKENTVTALSAHTNYQVN